LCKFEWAEARTVDFLERDGQPEDEPGDHMDLGEVISRQLDPREYPISASPYDDAGNYVISFALLLNFINHLKGIVGDREVDTLSAQLFKVMVGARRPATTDRPRQAVLEAQDSTRNKRKRFEAYRALVKLLQRAGYGFTGARYPLGVFEVVIKARWPERDRNLYSGFNPETAAERDAQAGIVSRQAPAPAHD